VIRRVRVAWPDSRLFADGRDTVRILAVSDAVDPALGWSANRDALGASIWLSAAATSSPRRSRS
jgi:hypothetical protein